MKHCVIEPEKLCDNCGDCERCELDPNKICDNCCKCLEREEDDDYRIFPLEQLEDSLKELQEQPMLLWDEDDEDGEEEQQELELPEIDPKLLLEWERKLEDYERKLQEETPSEDNELSPGRKNPRYGARQRRR